MPQHAWLVAGLLLWAACLCAPVASRDVVADAPVELDASRVVVEVMVAFLSSAGHDAADVAAATLLPSTGLPSSAIVTYSPPQSVAVFDNETVSQSNRSTTSFAVAAEAADADHEAERRSRTAAAERAVARDVGQLVLGADRSGLLDANITAGFSLQVKAELASISDAAADGPDAPAVTLATFNVEFDLGSLDAAALAYEAPGETIRQLLGNLTNQSLIGTEQIANATLLRDALNMTASNETIAGTGLPAAAAWLAGVASISQATLEALGVGTSGLTSRLRNLTGTVTAAANMETAHQTVAVLAGVGKASFAARLMRQVYLLDRRGGVGPAWNSDAVQGIKPAILEDLAAHLMWRPDHAEIPVTADHRAFDVKRDTGATPAARVEATLALWGRDPSELDMISDRLAGARLQLPRSSLLLQQLLGSAREAPVDMVVLRTVTEQRNADARVADSNRGCRHLGCWVPVVLWCGFLAVVGIVAAVATTGRAMTVEDKVLQSKAVPKSQPPAAAAAEQYAADEPRPVTEEPPQYHPQQQQRPRQYAATPSSDPYRQVPADDGAAQSRPPPARPPQTPQPAAVPSSDPYGTAQSPPRSMTLRVAPAQRAETPQRSQSAVGMTSASQQQPYRADRSRQSRPAAASTDFGTAVASEPGELDATTSAGSSLHGSRRRLHAPHP